VDPFYLAQKAQESGYYSELILTARRVNDSMAEFVAQQVVMAMIKIDAAILSVPHNEFINMDLKHLLTRDAIIYDVKQMRAIE